MSTLSTGFPISERLSQLVEKDFVCDARYILVVEKEAIFYRLCEDKIFNLLPLVIICGRGFPDIATRKLLNAIATKFSLPVIGLFDYNCGGLGVWIAYKFGSRNGLRY